MRSMKAWAAAICVAAVAMACGGGKSTPDPTAGSAASDLALELSSTQVDNSGTKSVTVTVTAVDASRVAVQDVPVTIAVDNNAVLVAGATKTDSSGKLTGTVSIGTDHSNRVVTVTATSGSLTRTAAFQVTGAKINATLVPAVVVPSSTGNQVQYQLVDVNSNPMAGQTISVSGSGLTPATGTTDIHGQYTYTYTAPATAGGVDITAIAGGYTSVQTIQVASTSSGTIPDAVGTILSASVSANPSVVGVNTATATNNQSDIRAVFLGASNAPIRNVRVRFDLNGDANSIGGTFSSGSNLLYSDANGVVTTAYVPGTRSSPTNGLTVRACYDAADFAAGTCPHQALATLTVSSEALSVTIGTNSELAIGAGNLTYIKRFVVLVADAAGQAKADVVITPSVDLLRYYKGYWSLSGSVWTQTVTAPSCPNEDLNRNGFLEAGEDDSTNPNGNNNGQLDPRKADVLVSVVGSNKTDANGMAIVQIEYPKNYGSWEDYQVLVSASGVAGTEGRDKHEGTLPVLADDVTNSKVVPAFAENRYGRGAVCSDPN